MRALLVLIGVLGLINPVAAAELTREDLTTWLDGFVPFAIGRADIAGASVAIVKDGEVLVLKGYGYADVATKQPVDPATTLFRVGSVSKLFTWTAAMQLVEQGRLDLDVDINKYLDFTIPPFQGHPVTLRQLMTHTAGFDETDKCVLSPDPKKAAPLEQIVKHCLPPRVYAPGTIPAYSNYGATLTGYLVQRVSGEPYDNYVESHIFAPLGMTHASFRQPLPAPLQPFMSRGYEIGSGPPQPYEITGVAPAGSLAASPADMSAFMIAHLQNGRFGTRRILSEAASQQMHTAALTLVPAIPRMVLGFNEVGYKGHRGIGHAGDTRIFHSALWLLPAEHIGIFIALNSTGNPELATGLRKGLFEGFITRYLPDSQAPESAAVPAPLAQEHAKLVAGTYEGSHRWVDNFMSLMNLLEPITVGADAAGHLTVSSMTAQGFQEVRPFVWQDSTGEQYLAARLNKGRVAMLGTGATEALLPAPAWRNASYLLPLIQLSLGAGVVTVVLWPFSAYMGRRRGRTYSWVRVATGLSTLLMLAWLGTLYWMVATFTLTAAMDPVIMGLHLASILVFPLAVGVAVWHVRSVWPVRHGWRNYLTGCWSVVLLVANLTYLWVAGAYHLLGVGLSY